MSDAAVAVFDSALTQVHPSRIIYFTLDSSAEHPLWIGGGFPDLDDLGLPDALTRRLQR